MSDVEKEVQALREEVHELKHQVVVDFTNHIMAQQKQISSRRGEPGPKGDSVVGPAGRDAVLVIKTNKESNVVRIFDESGTEKATIVSVPGRDGVGIPGKDGRDARQITKEEVSSLVRQVANELSDVFVQAVLKKLEKAAAHAAA